MRSSHSASALIALLSATAISALSPAKLHCLRSRSLELAKLAGCGEPGSVAHCIDMLPDDLRQTDLERCYIHAGCDLPEAIIESQGTLDRCGNDEKAPAELRKRHMPVLARQTTAAATTATEAANTATSTDTDTRSLLTCSTTTTKSTTLCPVVSTGVRKGMTLNEGCYPTQLVFATCAAGLRCTDDLSGNPSCLKLDNTVYPGGIAVAVFLAVAVAFSFGWLTFLCCRERKQKKRIAARAEAASIARQPAKAPTLRVENTDSQPLVEHGHPAVDYHDAHGPFSDQHRM
ncbi:uncharacterized protein LY79DRAFT_518268 [Colletotrichum navitas]|uniref:Uncharacterized protein n=1 Tax=Colletotrichum navitas TaxID=681940 RepID=A0AAD8PWW8_9PEZI|nr:uncharacterized protein LY79DRAFT_518268 [Colletotrichum navitas]KAK1585673.1 hypothetical protein LY79DRAFT_518268 [Colletotrichum navitas]